jgi:nicotinamide phosphoribosyltransferase
MYDPKICSMTSYLVPRGSRLPGQQWVMQMGLVPFIKKYLVEDFNESFFKQDWKNIEDQYYDVMTKSLGYKESDVKKTF